MLPLKTYLSQVPRILLFCVGAGVFLTWFTCPACHSFPLLYARIASFTIVVWFVMWFGNRLLADYLGYKISWIKFPVKRFIVGLLATLVFSVAAVYLLLFIFEHAFHLYFGNFGSIAITSLSITMVTTLFLHGREFLLNWKQSVINAERFQKESIQAQYDSLKNQVNPHFLFNSLNVLTHLVFEDQAKAVKFIKQMSDVYRYLLDTREQEVVELGMELDFLKAYVFLQEIRFDKNLKVIIENGLPDGYVPPLSLQLLVENAIKHNIVSNDEPLTIRIFPEDGYVVVENNIQRKADEGERLSGLGLQNIRKRYSFLTDKQVLITETNGKFVVRIPIININPA